MQTIETPFKRYVFDSTRTFDEVLRGPYGGIGTLGVARELDGKVVKLVKDSVG